MEIEYNYDRMIPVIEIEINSKFKTDEQTKLEIRHSVYKIYRNKCQ